jgi:ubiquinone/menaquinone biosynthesis C-methylase UbiE
VDITQSLNGSQMAAASLEVEWDYTRLADAYIRRPGYAPQAVDALLGLAGPGATRMVVDLGAGTGLLTAPLAERCTSVLALEPNQAMRGHGIARTSLYPNVRWTVGRMEDTGLPPGQFSLATCGSSFGVANHGATLREVARILEPAGWFACLWNYRDLQDPLQCAIETHIKANIPGFQYGSRREDQTSIITESGLFENVQKVESDIRHCLPKSEWIDAWRSHATLQRQAGSQFDKVVDGIAAIVQGVTGDTVEVPYKTRAWIARVRPAGVRGGID